MDLQKAIQEMALIRGWSDLTVMSLLCCFLENTGKYNDVMLFLKFNADLEDYANSKRRSHP